MTYIPLLTAKELICSLEYSFMNAESLLTKIIHSDSARDILVQHSPGHGG